MRIPGSWTIARPYGVPIRIHWSVPVCALLAGGIHVAPGAWLAYLLLVVIHEAGHAYVVRRAGARALALDVLGFGGLCWWDGHVTPIQRACIAWGGIWAQTIVLAVTGIAVLLFGMPGHWFAEQMVKTFLVSNLWLIGLNLLPIPPLDGKEAWTLFPLLRRRFAARRAQRERVRPLPAPKVHIARIAVLPEDADDFDEDSFTPEVADVLERVRAIVRREAARDPKEQDEPRGHDEAGAGKRDKKA
jgi:hypothetical protein